eukprot:1160261-Pelagomonas_calceolata.AAC.9
MDGHGRVWWMRILIKANVGRLACVAAAYIMRRCRVLGCFACVSHTNGTLLAPCALRKARLLAPCYSESQELTAVPRAWESCDGQGLAARESQGLAVVLRAWESCNGQGAAVRESQELAVVLRAWESCNGQGAAVRESQGLAVVLRAWESCDGQGEAVRASQGHAAVHTEVSIGA